jgi:hypothetical protein
MSFDWLQKEIFKIRDLPKHFRWKLLDFRTISFYFSSYGCGLQESFCLESEGRMCEIDYAYVPIYKGLNDQDFS